MLHIGHQLCRTLNEVVLPGEGVGDVLQHNEIIAAIEHVKADIELICLPVKPLSSRRILHHVNVDAALGTEQPEHVGHIVEKRMAVADKQNFHWVEHLFPLVCSFYIIPQLFLPENPFAPKIPPFDFGNFVVSYPHVSIFQDYPEFPVPAPLVAAVPSVRGQPIQRRRRS